MFPWLALNLCVCGVSHLQGKKIQKHGDMYSSAAPVREKKKENHQSKANTK